ncbi:Uncharacterised protein [Myroides odoratus]|uniref:Uncharacterized protein n=2 Tax=Myroides odoratus TaxID=256 RepID=A0A9Q6Z975_MYROD|nr:hypothetical protein Myrod_0421 [Myroides odoratus DSM 2801]EKB08572.1 hypothetical protein HMPREF9716_00923 [Myroides odoratus CIP 103059]QQU02022.1 hypothetical protein I6I88_10765 [Myroides odoratus]STZ32297.1 Uncharacterised protein [Myroides odoratus]
MFILLMVLCISCHNKIAGTLGGGYVYEFDCSENELNYCLESFKERRLNLAIPEKWKEFDDWEKRGYHFLNGKIFYFEGNADLIEEMYYVTVLRFSEEKTKVARVSIRSVFRKTTKFGQWLLFEDLKKSEQQRIERRFQELVLNEMIKNDCSCKEYTTITNWPSK